MAAILGRSCVTGSPHVLCLVLFLAVSISFLVDVLCGIIIAFLFVSFLLLLVAIAFNIII